MGPIIEKNNNCKTQMCSGKLLKSIIIFHIAFHLKTASDAEHVPH